MRITARLLTDEEAVSEEHGNANLMQSAPWGEFKRRRGHLRRRLMLSTPQGGIALLGITRPAGPEQTSLYVPFGPELDLAPEERGPVLEATAEAIAPQLPKDCVMLRFDLPWASPYIDADYYDHEGEWLGPPPDRIRELRMNAATEKRNLRKAPSDLNPPDTVVIDLRRTEEELLAAMRPKTRYNIRIAERHGVTVTEMGLDGLNAWYRLYSETSTRQAIVCEEESYFRDLFLTIGSGNRATPHKAEAEAEAAAFTKTRLHFYGAWKNGRLLGGVITAHHRRRAYYLFGARSSEDRAAMPSYALQWYAIRRAKAAGCRWYDMFGIPPSGDAYHPMHGLYRFKTGFGGRKAHYSGTWDYPLSADRYDELVQQQSALGRYHTGAR